MAKPDTPLGSPLGLTFFKGEKGIPSISGGPKNYRIVDQKAVRSLFDSGQFSPFPLSSDPASGSVDKIGNAFEIHTDSSNDLSITSIIEFCNQSSSMKLDYSHFAYLKNLGVYPNNRLIIARRFSAGVSNDLTAVSGSPLSTIVSYLPEDKDDFLSLTFNEEWEDAAGGFEEILNEIGKDVKLSIDQGTGLGTLAKNAFNIIPMPALMEGIQIKVREKMGLNGAGQGAGQSPYGNPNLIRQAKQRTVIGKGDAGSALTAKFSVEFSVEYEQKFIAGVDPSLVYLDILQNALSFGTSDAVFEYSPAFGQGVTGIIKDLISGNVNGILRAITAFVSSLVSALNDVFGPLIDKLIKGDDEEEPEGDELKQLLLGEVKNAIATSLGTVISKYKIQLIGVANALTGANSTPWHITIGNPKKPILSSGDMQCTSVTLTLGKVLAFNDLPSSIKLDIKMESARNLGAQEIFNRLNTGRGRSYKRFQKSFVEEDISAVPEEKKKEVDNKNKDKNGEQQTPPPNANAATTTQTAATTAATTDKKPPSEGKEKNVTTPTFIINTVEDPYDVNFGNQDTGSPWGVSPMVPPAAKPPKVGDQNTKAADNTGDTQGSRQSQNDPNVKTVVPGNATTATNTTPGSNTPGVTQSGQALQQQQAAGVTGSQAPQPENVPAPIVISEPEPRRDEDPEIVIGKDGKPTVVYPAGTAPTETTTQTQQTATEATAQTNQPVTKTTDDVKSEISREDKIKAYYASQSAEDHKRMIDYYTEQIKALDRKIEFEKEDLLDPDFAEDAKENIKRFEAERNEKYERIIRHQTELKNKSS